ncbi:hypothetical protein [Streptomyces sp. NPDC046821]|uniref:hypothetical protein n=1 Tax=Streptomyces sp. NPDC046821 TaxID=3154702 RepID=UPI0033CBB7F1
MTDIPTEVEPSEGQTVADELHSQTPSRRWFRSPLVRRSRLDEAEQDVAVYQTEAAKQAENVGDLYRQLSEKGAQAVEAEDRATAAEETAAGAEHRISELKEQLADAERRLRVVEEMREPLLSEFSYMEKLATHLQQGGRDLVAVFTNDDADEVTLDKIGQILRRHAHRFDLPAGDLAKIRRRPEPADSDDDESDHLPGTGICAAGA